MKKKNTVVVNGNKYNSIKIRLFIAIVLVVATVLITTSVVSIFVINNKFAEEVNEFYKLNSKTIFSIDKIYMYSNASATANEETRPIWNLNIFQFTDIAIYINNRSDTSLTNENSIKEMWIDNVKFGDVNLGTQGIYYKDVNNFGKSIIKEQEEQSSSSTDEETEESEIRSDNLSEIDRLDFKVVNDGDLDYSKPQIYADCSNPISLEYINKDIKKNQIISDITTDVTYDGSILRKSSIVLSDIASYVSFNINIVNNYNQQFVASVYIDIPLEDTVTGDTIYNGKFVKKLENTNLIRFFRVK